MIARSKERSKGEETVKEKSDFDQTLEAVRRLKGYEFRVKMCIALVFGWLLGVIMVCAILGVKPLW